MPAECDRFLFAINLRLDLAERQRGIGGLVGRKTVFLVFRPAAVIATPGIVFAARRETKTVIGFHALGIVYSGNRPGTASLLLLKVYADRERTQPYSRFLLRPLIDE